MDPIANETWKSFMRSYYRLRLLLLLSSLGEAYVSQLARMLRIPPGRVICLLEGDEKQGYAVALSLVPMGLAERKITPVKGGRCYEITDKGRRKARSVASAASRRATHTRPVGRVQEGAEARWALALGGRTGDPASFTWSVRG